MPRYMTSRQYLPRSVNIPLPAYRQMPYAAAPFVGGQVMDLMPNAGARLRIAETYMPHESASAKRSPRRFAIPELERKTRRVSSSYRPGRERPRTLAGQPWRPTEQRMRTVVPVGGRRFEVQ